MACSTHLDAREAKLPQETVRTTSDVATVTLAGRTGITGQLLQLQDSIPTRFFRSVHINDDSFQLGTRLVANLAASFARFASRAFMDVLAITLTYLRNGKLKAASRARLLRRYSGSGDGDIQTTDAIDLVIVDFREDDLLTHAHGVVTTAIERLGVQTTEVTDTRYGDANQPFQELPHTLATQGYFLQPIG